MDFSTASESKPTTTLTHPEGFGVDPESQTIVASATRGGGSRGELASSAAPSSSSSTSSLDDEGIAEYAVSRAAFSNIKSLTLYISENYGEETTKILYIGLRGEWTEMNKNPVITIYEAAANPKDHKNLVPGEKRVGYENA